MLNYNFSKGVIESIIYKGNNILAKESDIFSVRLLDKDGNSSDVSSGQAGKVEVNGKVVVFSDFKENFQVVLTFKDIAEKTDFKVKVINNTDKIIEHIEVCSFILKPLLKNGGIGKVLLPYNEGALIDDDDWRKECHLCHLEPEYPSQGSFGIFPNMICSQFMLYLFSSYGLYVGMHDKKRSLKEIDFYSVDEEKNIKFEVRLYSGKNYGEDFETDFDTVFEFFDGDWYDGAKIYKDWFEDNLPDGVVKKADNVSLPSWYNDFPIVLTYPVRGYFDTDKIVPNNLFPYKNAMKYVDKYSKATGAKVLVLLMHWEGTAPWAPPFVCPPYGEKEFDEFYDALKEKGHLLGVYCSGFSFTEQSVILPEYDCKEMLKDKEVFKAFCAGRDNKVIHSKICEGQRVGYDICVASDEGKKILDSAYDPLFAKHLDYVQILDQNHGGGQYFCYSKEHNHAPCVGPWMTETMQKLLGEWNKKAGATLLGCESASSEAFMGNLLFSDNRYELVHFIGKAVPLYAYLYHEYLHNFSGNQVCCTLPVESYLYRLAYSFSAGDIPTLVLNPDGFIQSYWGQRDITETPDENDVLQFIKTMRTFYMQNIKFMDYGKMLKPLSYKTGSKTYITKQNRKYDVPEVLSSAFEFEGEKIQIFVNYNTEDKKVEINGKTVTVKGLSVERISIS